MTQDDMASSSDPAADAPSDEIIPPVIAPHPLATDDDDEDDIPASITADEPTDDEDVSNEIRYDETTVDFRGEDREQLVDILRTTETEVGADTLDARVRTVGSYENVMYRAIMQDSEEERRIQEAIAGLDEADRKAMSHELRGGDDNKIRLRTGSIVNRAHPGEVKSFSGDEALLAFEYQEKGGGYRVLLHNSGISLDIIVPTGIDVQTMLTNCISIDRQLGSSTGGHYFTYGDLMYKAQIRDFIQPLIVNSSYVDWRKRNSLWSLIKFPDLTALVATLAAICYKNGFEGFVSKCTRPKSEEHPSPCGHTETITADIFKMIMTRWSAMSADSISFMETARSGNAKHTLSDIAKYQAGLGLEGERITIDNTTFVMRIPTIAEYMDAGSTFIADIVNEIQGDNTEGRYEQFGLRYVRTFLPWIASVEKSVLSKGSDVPSVNKTADSRVIVRQLERLEAQFDDDRVVDALRKYINKTQMTYVGYPVTQCPTCGYTADTPSGMYTFDPFNAFFTLAFLYTTQKA